VEGHDKNRRQNRLLKELRRERRYQCTITPAAVHPSGDHEPFEAQVVDVSKSGLLLRANRALADGEAVTISFTDQKNTKITAIARYCRLVQDETYEIGFETEDLHQE